MSSHEEYVRAPGKVITPTTVVLALITVVAFAIIGYRYLTGLGAVSNMSDGYPWGLWLAYDVAVGTAFACGGYALAIVAYIFNGWKYHPMIRSAVVASMFGYALGGFSVMVDIGRYWNAYGFFMPSRWQTNSVMFEVAVCIMAYTLILVIEFLPSLTEKLHELKEDSIFRKMGDAIAPKLDKILIFIIALGITLPTMHQSSLGSMFIIAGDKLHPLWQTNFLPLLFLLNALILGFAIVMFESGLSAVGFKRRYEKEALDLSKIIPYLGFAWLAVRFISLLLRGQFTTMFTSGFHSVMFWIEIGLVLAGTIMFMNKNITPRKCFRAAIVLALGGGLYRMNVYLIAYNPGDIWNAYFPSFSEFLITLGLVSFEVFAYIVLARVLRILPKEHGAH